MPHTMHWGLTIGTNGGGTLPWISWPDGLSLWDIGCISNRRQWSTSPLPFRIHNFEHRKMFTDTQLFGVERVGGLCEPTVPGRANACTTLSKKVKNTSAAYPTRKAMANGGIVAF